MEAYLRIKHEEDTAYDLCLSLSLVGPVQTETRTETGMSNAATGHGDSATEPELPYRTQLIVNLLLRVPAAFAGLAYGIAFLLRGCAQFSFRFKIDHVPNALTASFGASLAQCVDLDEGCSHEVSGAWCTGSANFTASEACCSCGGGNFLRPYLCGVEWSIQWKEHIRPLVFAMPYFIVAFLILRDLAYKAPLRVQKRAAVFAGFLAIGAAYCLLYFQASFDACISSGPWARREDEQNRLEYLLVACLTGTLTGALLTILILVAILFRGKLRPTTPARSSRVAALYTEKFGVNGTFFAHKVFVLQFFTVFLQTAAKLEILAGAVNVDMYTTVAMIYFWMYLLIICVNTFYPCVMLNFNSATVSRNGVAILDAFLDNCYIWVGVHAVGYTMGLDEAIPYGLTRWLSCFSPIFHISTVSNCVAGCMFNCVA